MGVEVGRKTVAENDTIIKHLVKTIISETVYFLYQKGFLKMHNTITVMSIDDTIKLLQTTNKSLARFGDGELFVMRGGTLAFQNSDPELAKELIEIASYQYDDLVISMQDIFNGVNQYVPKSRSFWKEHLLTYRKYYEKYCNPNRVYASTSFSRCYLTLNDKSKCKQWFNEIKKIWNEKDIVIVEGETTHNGVGNDLFNNCKSVVRIICPSTNAYASINKIYEACLKQRKDKVFLISLGPAAKPLVYKLFIKGYRAIDIGQLDTEYEWFKMNAVQKEKIEKHNVIGKEENLKKGYDNYLEEIRCVIKYNA